MEDTKVAVIGGCGHVGLPLALTLASRDLDVTIVDIDEAAVADLARGKVRFVEAGAVELLERHFGRNLRATTATERVRDVDVVICIVGTPIGPDQTPHVAKLQEVLEGLSPYLKPAQLFVLRSTVYPGATSRIGRWLQGAVPGIDVAYCPERVAQGHAVEEIGSLPQIVSATSDRAARRAEALFGRVAPRTLTLSPGEAELTKLICNAWRYVTFAAANEFYALCASQGVDYARVQAAVVADYPRAAGLPRAGFAAGPCLLKDTMQLTASHDGGLSIGNAALQINEGFPQTLMRQLRPLGLAAKVVGLLGVAFKADSDDTRDSLAFKMRNLLELECRRVLCTDPFVRQPWLLPLETVLDECDVIVIGAPHSVYRHLSPTQPTLDPWGHLGRGSLLT